MDPRGSDDPLSRTEEALRRRVSELESRVAELEVTENRYRVLFESNPTMYFTLDREGVVRQVNGYGAAKLGYEVEELIGRPVLEVFHEEERKAVRSQLDRCLERPGEVVEWELRKVHRSGRVIWVHEAATTVLDARGEPMVLVVCTDVGVMKEVQRELEAVKEQLEERVAEQTQALKEKNASLEQSERRYRSLVESQNEMIVRWKPDGIRTFVNDAYCRYFGRSRAELVGKSFIHLVAEEEREQVRKKVETLNPEQPWALDIHRVLRPDGSEAWNEWSDRALFDDDGRMVEIQSVGRDVTDRVRASEKLQQSEERYRLLAENISDVIVRLDLDLTLRWVSPSVRLLLGTTPEEFCALRLDELLSADSVALAEEVLVQELEREQQPGTDPLEARTLDLELRSPAGESVICEVKASFLRDPDGTPTAILAVMRDITQWKTTQDALRRSEQMLFQTRKLEAIGKLTGGLAHDFNNLLTVIYGNLDLLVSELDSGGATPVELDEIRDAADRGAVLIRQLLAFGSRQVVAPELLDLDALVRGTLEMLPRLLGEDVEILAELDPDLGPVRADPAQMEQALVNLAVNARDAMPTGGRLTVSTSQGESAGEGEEEAIEGRWVELRVSDTGVGIPEEDLDRVFDPFFTTKGEGTGSGLGLASVYGAVQQAGGKVSIASEEGSGTTFTIRLPEAARDEEATVASAELGPTELRGDETVLVTEDDAGVRLLVRRTLEVHGFRVFEASSGEEALEILGSRGDEIDLLLSDLIMPGISGSELADRLAVSRPQIRVLLMTGHSRESVVRLGGLARSADPLLKPFTPNELIQRVRDALAHE